MSRVSGFVSLSLALGVVLLALPATAANYEIDSTHSGVVFKVGHLGVSNFYGRFNEIEGTFSFDEQDPESASFLVTINAGSVDTHAERRDTHLKSPDFLNAKQFPAIMLKSKSVKKAGKKAYQATVELSLHGVKKEITIDITHIGSGDHPRFGARAGFESVFTVSRSDYGIDFMPGGIGDEVEITVFIKGARQ